MKPERPLAELSEFEIGYICGLIVGEGSFTIGSRKPRGNTVARNYGSLEMKLHRSDPEPLKFLLRSLGGNMYGPYHHGGRDYYLWRLTGYALNDAVPLLYRYMPPSRKREQLEAWLDTYNRRPLVHGDT
jgi:hypothetical protein